MLGELLRNPLSSESTTSKEIKTDLLKVRDRTLVFNNSIYQIANISAVHVLDLSTTKPIPRYFLLILIAGLGLLAAEDLAFIGVLVLGLLAFLFYRYWKDKLDAAYGLMIVVNAGIEASPILVSTSSKFLKEIALTLLNIINSDEGGSVTFNFDHRRIIDVDNMSGSTFVGGSVSGDIVNNV